MVSSKSVSIRRVPPGGIRWLTIELPGSNLFLTMIFSGVVASADGSLSAKIYALYVLLDPVLLVAVNAVMTVPAPVGGDV